MIKLKCQNAVMKIFEDEEIIEKYNKKWFCIAKKKLLLNCNDDCKLIKVNRKYKIFEIIDNAIRDNPDITEKEINSLVKWNSGL